VIDMPGWVKSKKAVMAKELVPTEDDEQIRLVVWLTKLNVPFYHIPNQRRCSVAYGAKLKRLGVSAGVPDICLPIAKGKFHGLYIELKRSKGGHLSISQKCWINRLMGLDYAVEVAYGYDEAVKIITAYLAS
jgi:VRR-NUC domain